MDEPLDKILKAAFDAEPGQQPSILQRIEARGGTAPRVHLREPDGEDAPVQRPQAPTQSGRYMVVGELARGGVGVVLQGRDIDLGRDVAMKFLHEEHAGNAALVERFIEEAQVAGQLQHPGIVPVYELGIGADGRPFFAMQLIRGKTLASLLKDRASPSEDRAALLEHFLRICDTMAYAHSRGVIHRDLKPSNVMVGRFGEVVVVDWGFAKILRTGDPYGAVPTERAAEEGESAVSSVRSHGEGSSESVTGAVMGTPGYMPPEQARGEVEKLDERADVFSLGAIMCEILTGAPPYRGDTGQMVVQAASAQLDDAYGRLDTCNAEPELIDLARRCLAPDPNARPEDGAAVARAIRSHQDQVEARMEASRIRRQESRVRRAAMGAEQARAATRQRAWMAVAAVVVLAVTVLLVFYSAHRARLQTRIEAAESALERHDFAAAERTAADLEDLDAASAQRLRERIETVRGESIAAAKSLEAKFAGWLRKLPTPPDAPLHKDVARLLPSFQRRTRAPEDPPSGKELEKLRALCAEYPEYLPTVRYYVAGWDWEAGGIDRALGGLRVLHRDRQDGIDVAQELHDKLRERGEMLVRRKREAGLDLLVEAHAVDPDNAETAWELGEAYRDIRADTEAQAKYWERAALIQEKYRSAALPALVRAGRLKHVVDWARELLVVRPKDPLLREILAQVATREEKYDEAYQRWEEWSAVASTRQREPKLIEIANAAWRAGRVDRAIELLEESARVNNRWMDLFLLRKALRIGGATAERQAALRKRSEAFLRKWRRDSGLRDPLGYFASMVAGDPDGPRTEEQFMKECERVFGPGEAIDKTVQWWANHRWLYQGEGDADLLAKASNPPAVRALRLAADGAFEEAAGGQWDVAQWSKGSPVAALTRWAECQWSLGRFKEAESGVNQLLAKRGYRDEASELLLTRCRTLAPGFGPSGSFVPNQLSVIEQNLLIRMFFGGRSDLVWKTGKKAPRRYVARIRPDDEFMLIVFAEAAANMGDAGELTRWLTIIADRCERDARASGLWVPMRAVGTLRTLRSGSFYAQLREPKGKRWHISTAQRTKLKQVWDRIDAMLAAAP